MMKLYPALLIENKIQIRLLRVLWLVKGQGKGATSLNPFWKQNPVVWFTSFKGFPRRTHWSTHWSTLKCARCLWIGLLVKWVFQPTVPLHNLLWLESSADDLNQVCWIVEEAVVHCGIQVKENLLFYYFYCVEYCYLFSCYHLMS